MKFPVSINLNIDKKASVKNGGISAIGNHADRTHGYQNNDSIDHDLSKYNEYHTYFDSKAELTKILSAYVKHHDNMKSIKKNPQRKYNTVWGNNGLVAKRGQKLPFKFICIKFGDGATRLKLAKMFIKHGYTYQDYANALNKSFRLWKAQHDKKFSNLKIGYMYSNLDEIKNEGGDHAHVGILSDTKTKSGKISLSFDRGTRVAYGGKSNIGAWHQMQVKESTDLAACATQVFQHYLGNDFSFKSVRSNVRHPSQDHNELVATKKLEDKITHSSKNTERASHGSLMRKLHALIKQNKKSSQQVKNSTDATMLLTKQNANLKQKYNKLVQKYNRLTKRLPTLTTHLSTQNSGLKNKYQKLHQNYNQLLNKYQTLLDQLHGLINSSQTLAKLLQEPNSLLVNLLKGYCRRLVKSEIKKGTKHGDKASGLR